ncbi:hypothetical protein [Trichoplusia ni ascovirus 2c]|uniref:hypothetical protein n=1 Tax=Trichoplusia ni ascovirus 2c TaxID=328615 RepID=UPI0000E4422C|nr:hypothetical protein TNAV2c_gp084 [Trichoplusia ni ascovirus 2c]ABF70601.1 hypothetical protein [Trichoplusia ni ascovirus 2c]AUS94189.1 hypothetical protein [Trichoplusia ni ascovirus 6b]
MDPYQKYYDAALEVIPFGAQNWTQDKFPHIPETTSSKWIKNKQPQRLRLVFFEKLFVDFYENRSRLFNQDEEDYIKRLQLAANIISASMTEACGAATCDEYARWTMSELTLNGEHGTFAQVFATASHPLLSEIRGMSHTCVGVMKTHQISDIFIDTMNGSTIVGCDDYLRTNNRIIYGVAIEEASSLICRRDTSTIINLPLSPSEVSNLTMDLYKYREIFIDNKEYFMNYIKIDGTDDDDILKCYDRFTMLLLYKIVKLYKSQLLQ